MQNKEKAISVVMLGATGAVGTQALNRLQTMPEIIQITTLGRRPVPDINDQRIAQHKIDIFKPDSYADLLKGHESAICTLGVGQPSKISKEDFLKIDKLAVLDFAKACKNAGVQHFELLSSVGINSKSSTYYLRIKGELVDELKALDFKRLSIFQPSMILTPTNRYGFGQAVTLAIWPVIDKLFFGSWKKFRGIKVDVLGKAFAENLLTKGRGFEILRWDDFRKM